MGSVSVRDLSAHTHVGVSLTIATTRNFTSRVRKFTCKTTSSSDKHAPPTQLGPYVRTRATPTPRLGARTSTNENTCSRHRDRDPRKLRVHHHQAPAQGKQRGGEDLVWTRCVTPSIFGGEIYTHTRKPPAITGQLVLQESAYRDARGKLFWFAVLVGPATSTRCRGRAGQVESMQRKA